MMSRWLLVSVGAAAPVALNAASVFAASLRGAPSLSLEAVETFESRRHLGGEDAMGGSYEHLGCFNDARNERLLGFKTTGADMSPMACHTHCDSKGAAFMATQYGNECWCSLVGSLEYRKQGAGTCDMFCEGAPDETCGGSDAFDLYKMEWAPASTDSEYVGCFADSKAARLMGDLVVQADMTSEVCRDHCMTKGTVFYATQFGDECWCGTSSMRSNYERHGEGICHMRCSGDDTTACGGYDAFSLFEMSTMEDGSGDAQPTTTPSLIDSQESESSDPTPSPVAQRRQPTPASGGGGGGDNVPAEYAGLLELHNEARCMHNADPLEWDSDAFKTAQDYAAVLTNSANCGTIFHSDNSYGENLYLCGSTGEASCYTAEGAMEALYTDELTGNVNSYGGHATAILWKATERVGCAVDTCESGDFKYHTLVCNFDPAGNSPATEQNVELPSKTEAECAL